MSRQLEQHAEEKAARRHASIVRAVEYELSDALAASKRELLGFSVKLSGGDCLITVRCSFGGAREVCFVGAEDLGSALIKCVREGRTDKLKWRADKFGG